MKNLRKFGFLYHTVGAHEKNWYPYGTSGINPFDTIGVTAAPWSFMALGVSINDVHKWIDNKKFFVCMFHLNRD